jgi:hypothetical protein
VQLCNRKFAFPLVSINCDPVLSNVNSSPILRPRAENVAGFAAHFVLAQLLPQYLNDYDGILATQLRNISLGDARQGAKLGESLATSLLQERSAVYMARTHGHHGDINFFTSRV